MTGRARSLLFSVLVLFACLASGTLECGRAELTADEGHGAKLYARMCGVCHGGTGRGYAADQAPALAHPDFLASATDDYLRIAIADGRNGTTMSAWGLARGGPLSVKDVGDIVKFIRTWEKKPRAVLDERLLAGNPLHGSSVLLRECVACHGPHGTGGPNVNIGSPQLLASASDGFLRYAIGRGRPGTAMPSFGPALGVAGVDDVIALLRTWQASGSAVPSAPPARPPPIPLGPVPLNPRGPEPIDFHAWPGTTPAAGVKAQLDRRARMALLDARAPSDYVAEHIAGAVSVPFYDPDPYIPALPKDAWLVCYCSCPHAESGQLAQKLVSKGFTKVTVLDEGLGFWRNKKYPTKNGEEP